MNLTKANNASQILSEAIRCSQSMHTLAKDLQHKLDVRVCPAVEPGRFYLTLDRSLVFVAKLFTRCRCPQCTGQTNLLNIGGVAVQMIPLSAITEDGTKPAEPNPEHETDPNKRHYVAVVIRGGHSIKGIAGEEPGDKYIIDGNGLAMVQRAVDGGGDVVTAASLAVAGLSLAREIRLTVTETAQTDPINLTEAGNAR